MFFFALPLEVLSVRSLVRLNVHEAVLSNVGFDTYRQTHRSAKAYLAMLEGANEIVDHTKLLGSKAQSGCKQIFTKMGLYWPM